MTSEDIKHQLIIIQQKSTQFVNETLDMKDRTTTSTSLVFKTRTRLDTVFKPGEILATFGTMCVTALTTVFKPGEILVTFGTVCVTSWTTVFEPRDILLTFGAMCATP